MLTLEPAVTTGPFGEVAGRTRGVLGCPYRLRRQGSPGAITYWARTWRHGMTAMMMTTQRTAPAWVRVAPSSSLSNHSGRATTPEPEQLPGDLEQQDGQHAPGVPEAEQCQDRHGDEQALLGALGQPPRLVAEEQGPLDHGEALPP